MRSVKIRVKGNRLTRWVTYDQGRLVRGPFTHKFTDIVQAREVRPNGSVALHVTPTLRATRAKRWHRRVVSVSMPATIEKASGTYIFAADGKSVTLDERGTYRVGWALPYVPGSTLRAVVTPGLTRPARLKALGSLARRSLQALYYTALCTLDKALKPEGRARTQRWELTVLKRGE